MVGVLNRVRANARQGLLEQVGVRCERESRRAVDRDPDSVPGLKRRGNLLEERCELDLREPERLVAQLGSREHKKGARQPGEPIGLARDHVEESSRAEPIVLCARPEHLDGGHDRGERRPELVGGVRRELSLDALVALALRLVEDDDDRAVAALAGGIPETRNVLSSVTTRR